MAVSKISLVFHDLPTLKLLQLTDNYFSLRHLLYVVQGSQTQTDPQDAL
jgi:hypothetical protein